MKKIILIIVILISAFSSIAQCTNTSYKLKPFDYPYTNAQGIVVSLGSNPLITFTPSTTLYCGIDSFTSGYPCFGINQASDSVVFVFSIPVSNFTIMLSRCEINEEYKFYTNNGKIELKDYCTAKFDTCYAGSGLKVINTIPGEVKATLVTVNNIKCATRYTIRQNMLSQGAIVSLLDCYSSHCPIVIPEGLNNLIKADNSKIIYYNLQGIEIDLNTVPSGLYIKKQENKTTKIIK
jgi:hypothetical protein